MGRFSKAPTMEDRKDLDILTVTTTVGSAADAQRLAREIVSRRLASCVQVEAGLQSFYHWQGQLCEEPEVRLVIKTLPACEQALQQLFAQHHPYEVPQFVGVTMRASEAYARWAHAEVRLPG
jgi:periplasmic divalent cation tolerance protein